MSDGTPKDPIVEEVAAEPVTDAKLDVSADEVAGQVKAERLEEDLAKAADKAQDEDPILVALARIESKIDTLLMGM